MADNKPINREIPCLNYLPFLPEEEERLSVCIKILKRHDYSPDLIKSYLLRPDTCSLFESKADYDTITRLFPGFSGSCVNNAKSYFKEYGFNKKLCKGCVFHTKCKNTNLVEEGEVLGYLLDHCNKNGLMDGISGDLFNGIATYYEHSKDGMSFRNIPFMKGFFNGIKAMLEVADIPSFQSRKDPFDVTIQVIKNEKIDGISSKEIDGFSDELIKYILHAKELQDREFHDKVAFLNAEAGSSEPAKRSDGPIHNAFLNKDLAEIPSSAPAPVADNIAPEPVKITSSDDMDSTETMDYFDGNVDLAQDDSFSFPKEDPTPLQFWANPIARQIDEANRNFSLGKGLFDNNGALILSRKEVFNLCVTVLSEDFSNIFDTLDMSINLNVEVVKVEGKYGMLINTISNPRPYFIPEHILSKSFLETLFSTNRYVVYTTSNTMISRCLYMKDVPVVTNIRSLSAAYATLNGVEKQINVAQIFAFSKEYYSDNVAYYFELCMPKYMDLFWNMYEKIEKKDQHSLYHMHANYEQMLGSSLTMSRFFECNSENLHRNSYQDSSFLYSPLLKKRGDGAVLTYTFNEAKPTKKMDMMLMEYILLAVSDYSFVQRIEFILLSIKVGEMVLFCPFEKLEHINSIHQNLKLILVHCFYDRGFTSPLVKKSMTIL